MKEISIFLLVMLFAVPVFSLDDIILNGDGTQVYYYYDDYNNLWWYLGGGIAIGTEWMKIKARSYIVYDLSAIPDNATIEQVDVLCSSEFYPNGYFTITKPSSILGSEEDVWNAIRNGNVLEEDIPYNTDQFTSENIKTQMINDLSSNQLIIGVFSQVENTNDTYTSMSLDLYVVYSTPPTQLDLVVKNDLYGADGGNIGVAIYPSSAVSHGSPYSFTAYTGDRLNLAAYDNQSVNGKTWFFNDNEYGYENSEWRKEKKSQSNFLSYYASFTTDELANDDDGASFIAYLKHTTYTTSGALSESESWWTPVSLSGNVTVPSGKTLTITSTGSVDLNGYYIKSTGGTITNNGTVDPDNIRVEQSGTLQGYYPTINSAISNASSGQTVHLYSGTFSGSVTVSNKYNVDIVGEGYNSTSIGNISITNSDGCDLSDLNTGGISVNNSWIAIDNVEGYNLTIYGDEVQINNSIFNGTQSANQITNCDGTIADCEITDLTIGVYLLSNSLYNVGNNYFCQNEGDIYAYSGSTAHAMYNTYSYNPYQSCSGNVIISGSTDVCGSKNLAKSNIENRLSSNGAEPANQEFSVIDEHYAALLQAVNDERVVTRTVDRKNYENDYAKVIADYQAFLAKYPNSNEAPAAIFRIVHCYQQQDDYPGYYEFINGLLKADKHQGIKPQVERHLINYYIQQQAYQTAIETADKVISSSSKDENLYCELLYEKGLIYQYQLNEPEKAKALLITIVKEHPDNKMVSYAKNELELMGYKLEKELPGEQDLATSELSCDIYPNPFNPETTIRFELPEDAHLTIKVYNILGEEITTLVNEYKTSGEHAIQWNGQDRFGNSVANGVYWVRLRAGEFSAQRKLVLLR